MYHWLNYEFGSLNFFWCGFEGGRACFKVVFCWGWYNSLDSRLLNGWDGVVIVIFRVLSLDDSWLLLVVLGAVGRRAAAGAAGAAGIGAAIVIPEAVELVVDLVLDLLLQLMESSTMFLLMLGIVHFGGAGLMNAVAVCLVFLTLVGGVDVVLSDMFLSGFYNVRLARGVRRREDTERNRYSSVKVQIEGLQREGAPEESCPFKLFGDWGLL